MAFQKKVDPNNPTYSMGFKVRLYPTEKQAEYIHRACGSTRFVYNKLLANEIAIYQAKKESKELPKKLNEKVLKNDPEFSWLKEIDSTALQQARINLSTAYTNFFKSVSGRRKGSPVGFPKFKSKKSGRNNFTTVMGMKHDFQNKTIKILKVKDPIKFAHKSLPKWVKNVTKLCKVTISFTSSGKYYASLLFDVKDNRPTFQFPKETPKAIGLDMAMGKLYVDSDGKEAQGFEKKFSKYQKRLCRLSRSHSRKTKGGSNREKSRKKLAILHEKIANQRKDYLHKESRRIVDSYDIIGIETLNLKALSKRFGKSIMENGWGMFTSMLSYKSINSGKWLVKADRWFASTKTCSCCGHKLDKISLGTREWTCPRCSSTHNRDHNAAINLRDFWFKESLVGWEAPELTPVETRSSDQSMKQEKDPVGTSRKINDL